MDNGASSYRRFLDGDEHAFDEIMKELFRGLVFFICAAACSGADRSSAPGLHRRRMGRHGNHVKR